jgi:hypothetical protein
MSAGLVSTAMWFRCGGRPLAIEQPVGAIGLEVAPDLVELMAADTKSSACKC